MLRSATGASIAYGRRSNLYFESGFVGIILDATRSLLGDRHGKGGSSIVIEPKKMRKEFLKAKYGSQSRPAI